MVSFGALARPDEARFAARGISRFSSDAASKGCRFREARSLELPQALVAELPPSAMAHVDRPAYRDVIGISFSSSCRFRFRRKRGSGWERASLIMEPRSVYLLRGPALTEWQRSIPPAERLRYSVTFRSMRAVASAQFLRGARSLCQPLNSAAIGAMRGGAADRVQTIRCRLPG